MAVTMNVTLSSEM